MVLSAVADLSQYVVRTPGRILLPRSPFAFPNAGLLTRMSDTLPIYFDSLQHVDFLLTLYSQDTELSPDSTVLKSSPGISFVSALENSKAGGIVFHAEIERYPKQIEGAARERFMAFCRAYLVATRTMYSLKGKDK